MKIVTGHSQLSSSFLDVKNPKPGLVPVDPFSEAYLRSLARQVHSKTKINLLRTTSLEAREDIIHLAYFPKGGDPNPEIRLREVNRLIKLGQIVTVISDYGPEASIGGSSNNHAAPLRRSANQGYIDDFKSFGIEVPDHILFFTWEISPSQDQMEALGTLASASPKVVKKAIESATIIATKKK